MHVLPSLSAFYNCLMHVLQSHKVNRHQVQQRRHATINGQCFSSNSSRSSSIIKKVAATFCAQQWQLLLVPHVAVVHCWRKWQSGSQETTTTANKPSAISQNITAKNLPPIKDCCSICHAIHKPQTSALREIVLIY